MTPRKSSSSVASAPKHDCLDNTKSIERRSNSDGPKTTGRMAGKKPVYIDLTGSPTKPVPSDYPIDKDHSPTEVEKKSQPSEQARPQSDASPALQLEQAPQDVEPQTPQDVEPQTPVPPKGNRPSFPSVKAHSSPAAISEPSATDRDATPSLIPGEIDEVLAAYIEKPRLKLMEKVGRVYVFDVLYKPRGVDLVKVGESQRPTPSRSKALRDICDLHVKQRSSDTVFAELPFYHRVVERLVHLELAGSRFSFPQPCPCRTKKHSEFFVVDRDVAVKSVQRWTKFCLQNPYELTRREDGERGPKFQPTLKPEWRRKLLRRVRATADETIYDHKLRGARWDCFVEPPDPAQEWKEELSLWASKAENHVWQLWSTLLAFWLCFCCFGKFNVLLAFGTLIGFLFHLGDNSLIARLVSKHLDWLPQGKEEFLELHSKVDQLSVPPTPKELVSSSMDVDSPSDSGAKGGEGENYVYDEKDGGSEMDEEGSERENGLPPLLRVDRSGESDNCNVDRDSALGSSPSYRK